MFTLNDLKINESAYINTMQITDNYRRRLLDLGFIKNNKITALYKSPSGNPTAYLIKGTIIALRNEDAKKITLYKNFD